MSERETLTPPPSRADEIRALRKQGLLLREICERLGVAKSVVNRALYPRVRAYEADYNRDRYRTNTCVVCGKPCVHNKHDPKAKGKRCRDCYMQRRVVES